MLNTAFEKEVCGRCGGSGNYSFNLMHGTICYGCGGKGERLTKRGSAAAAYYRELNTVPLSEVKPGDVLQHTGVTVGGATFQHRVTVAEITGPEVLFHSIVDGERIPVVGLTLTLKSKVGPSKYSASADTPTFRYPQPEARQEAIDKALAYQATLTKTGKPNKRLAKAA